MLKRPDDDRQPNRPEFLTTWPQPPKLLYEAGNPWPTNDPSIEGINWSAAVRDRVFRERKPTWPNPISKKKRKRKRKPRK